MHHAGASVFDIIRKLPDDEVTVTVDEKFRVFIRGGISSFTITAMNAEDYPELPDVESERAFPCRSASCGR